MTSQTELGRPVVRPAATELWFGCERSRPMSQDSSNGLKSRGQ